MSFPLLADCHPRSEPMSFFQGIKLVMGHGPYAKLVMVFLFTSLAFMVRFPEKLALICHFCSSHELVCVPSGFKIWPEVV